MAGKLSEFASKGAVSKFFYLLFISYFLLLIFLPTTSLLFSLNGFKITGEMVNALIVSFEIAFIAVFVDILLGLPIAWILARYKLRFKSFLDALVDMPLILPTSALGFSVVLFWGADGLNFFSQGFWALVSVHIAMTYPYLVRVMAAAIEEIDITYETAARTLGATQLTAFRTVTAPLFKNGLLVGAVLALTRSLGETGASAVAIDVKSALRTVPTQILDYKNGNDLGSAVSLAIILILISVLLLLLVRFLAKSFKVPIKGISPNFERGMNGLSLYKNAAALLFLLLIVILPCFFFFKFANFVSVDYSLIIDAILLSFFISAVATAANLVFSVAIAYIIAKNKFRMGLLLDVLNDVVLVMPTVAIGLSIGMFWGNFKLNEVLVVILANMSFSFPYIVKPVAAAIQGIDTTLEDAARSLGAKPFDVFRTITLPLIKPSIIAGTTIAFMRSLSDTGAVMMVSKTLKPISVLIVNLSNTHHYAETSVAAAILFIVSFAAIIIMRRR